MGISSQPVAHTPTAIKPVFITLGSNIAPETNLPRAVQLLKERVPLFKGVSRVYETAPLNAAGKAESRPAHFLNAAALIETDLPPITLKYGILRAIEDELGRVRTADKFAPRTIDLDIALYGDLVVDQDDPPLRIPDPDILTRAHVALPLADLMPNFKHPVTGQTLAAIAAPFKDQAGITIREDVSLAT